MLGWSPENSNIGTPRLCDRAFSDKRSRAAIKTIMRTQGEVVCDPGEEGGRLDPRQNMTLGEWGESRTP